MGFKYLIQVLNDIFYYQSFVKNVLIYEIYVFTRRM